MNDQSAAKFLSSNEYGKGSETIPKGSREEIPETGGALTSNVEGNDIVRIKNLSDFIKKAQQIHGDKYDYSKFVYISAKTKGIIICKEHGEFEQTPDKHFQGKFCCPKCFSERPLKHEKKIKKKQFYVTKEIFLFRANDKFGELYEYDLTNFDGSVKNKIRIKCKKHGWFEQLPHNHLSKHVVIGCPICADILRIKSKTKSYEYAIEQFNKIYDNYYTYPESNSNIYVNKKSIITIICPTHGEFKKKAQKHLAGQGCFKCRIDKLVQEGKLLGGYSFDLFEEKPFIKDLSANIYYAEFNNGEYYKIGITTNLSSRIKGLRYDSKSSVKILLNKKGSLYECFCLEQDLLDKFSYFRTCKYSWSTELFCKNIYDKIKDRFL